MDTGTATRTLAGPSYQILNVCVPDSSESPDSGSDEPGRSGRPSDAVSWMVAVIAGGAWPRAITDPATTIPTAATAPTGTAHLARPPRSNFAAALTGTSRGEG